MSLTLRSTPTVTPVKRLPVAPATAAVSAKKPVVATKPAGHAGRATGAVAGAGVVAGAYALMGLFRNGPGGLLVAALPAALAAVGGWKLGAYFDRGQERKQVTVGGVVGGALPLVGFGFGTLLFLGAGPVAVGLMVLGTVAATAGGAAIGRSVEEGIQKLRNKQ